MVGVDPGLGAAWPPQAGEGLHLPSGERAWLHSGRAAVRWLLQGRRVLVPAYMCDSVVQALTPAGFYHVDAELRVDWPGLSAATERHSPDAVVLVHYFGFLQDRDPLAAFRARFPSVRIVEDLSHSLLNAPGHQGLHDRADYGFASLRKLLPVPDGAVVIDYRGAGLPPSPPEPSETPQFTRDRLAALERRSASLFAKAEQALDREAPVVAASALSRQIVASVPAKLWRARRRANWRALSDVLPSSRALAAGVAPFGFPVRVPNRHDLGRRLAGAGIETQVHWPLGPAANRQERLLAGTLLTLPCGPACRPADLRTIAAQWRRG